MQRTKHIIFLLFLSTVVLSCIKPFDPVIDSGAEHKYVVSGCITDQEGYQSVFVSISSPIEEPNYIPLTGCYVTVFSDAGKTYALEETGPGEYGTWMEANDLLPGTSYQVVVNTPSGDVLTSEFDKMPESPPLDTVYFWLEDHATPDPAIDDRGIQFYVDLEADDSDSRFYRWEVAETWEYHAAHAKEHYYDGDLHAIDPPDSSTWKCWQKSTIRSIYTLSTQHLTANAYYQYPLHFVNGKTSKLSVLYSFLITQYALSETAYTYWEQLRENSYEEIGLYEKQPADIKGNITMTSGNGEEVLGLFYAASIRTKRIFVQNVEGLEINYPSYCNEYSLGRFGWAEFRPNEYPVYFYYLEWGGLLILTRECVECEMMGGTTVKPDFWPE